MTQATPHPDKPRFGLSIDTYEPIRTARTTAETLFYLLAAIDAGRVKLGVSGFLDGILNSHTLNLLNGLPNPIR